MRSSWKALVLSALLVGTGTGLAQDGDSFGQTGTAEDDAPRTAGEGATPGDAAAADAEGDAESSGAPAGQDGGEGAPDPGLSPLDGMPHVTYQVMRDGQGEWVQGADHFHPVLDTFRYSNPGTPLFPGGTCYGMVRMTKRWYDTFTKPILSLPNRYGPANAIEDILAYDPERRRYHRVYNQNIDQFRLRAFTQPRSARYPFADPRRTARLATAMHSNQFRGSGPFENQWVVTREAIHQRMMAIARNFYMGDDGQARTHAQVAERMQAAIRNRTEEGAFQLGGQVGYKGFAGFVFPMFLVPRTGGGEDGTQPVLDGSQLRLGFHIVLAYRYREVRVRGADGEHDAVEFRFYDVNRPELPEDPGGVEQGSVPDSATERENRLFYLRDLGRFSFGLGYMLHYADVDPSTLILLQEGHVMNRPVGYTDFTEGVTSSTGNPVETASREAWTFERARDRPDQEFDWGRGGTGTGVQPGQ